MLITPIFSFFPITRSRLTYSLLMLSAVWLTTTNVAVGQAADTLKDNASSIAHQFARYNQQGPQEKLYLHLDRPAYSSGELLWFKVYAVDATFSRPLMLSSVAYVEVLDGSNRPVLQGTVKLQNATGQGSFNLPAGLASGAYTVRAYTSWMKNFAPEAYFHTPITIFNTSRISGTPIEHVDSTAVEAHFFPEGGYLVQGLSSKVGFKITDHHGRGIVASGQVFAPTGEVVATFSTIRMGMGSFLLTPKTVQGEYVAVLKVGTRQVVRQPLPRVQANGYVLHLAEQPNTNHLILTIKSTTAAPETIFLLAHSQQQVAAATQAVLLNGHAIFIIDKRQLRPGVSHFTLFNNHQQPLAERLFFIPPGPSLAITAQADKAGYSLREKVRVQFATTAVQAPLATTLSMAVYRLDSLNTTSAVAIDHYLNLTSDLRGEVENPGYYFNATGPIAAEAADNLMLTQGWSRFQWSDVLTPEQRSFVFLPEPHGPVIRGQLTQKGRPQPGVLAYLSVPSRITRLNNSLSNTDGLIQFEMNEFFGAQEVIVQTDARQDSTSRVQLFSPFSTRFAPALLPPFGLRSNFRVDYALRHLQTQVERAYTARFRSRFVVMAQDSVPFFGKPDETYLLDKYTRFKVMEEVLREYVPGVVVRIRKDGFHFQVVDKVNKTVLSENPMVLLDGVPVFNLNRIMAINPLKIQKLDVVDSRYLHGLAICDGIVSFTTYKGDLEGFSLDPRVLVQRYEGVQRQREFYSPRYDTPQARQSHLPDLRNLLYWNSTICTTGPESREVEFFTGDQAGHYLVEIQGITTNGISGSTRFVLDVKPTL